MKRLLTLLLCASFCFSISACSSKEKRIIDKAEKVMENTKEDIKNRYGITCTDGEVMGNTYNVKCGYYISNIDVFLEFNDSLDLIAINVMKDDLTDRNLQNSIQYVDAIFIRLFAEFSPTPQVKEVEYPLITDMSISDTFIFKNKTIGDYETEVTYFSPSYERADGSIYELKKPLTTENKEFKIKATDNLISNGSYFLTVRYNK